MSFESETLEKYMLELLKSMKEGRSMAAADTLKFVNLYQINGEKEGMEDHRVERFHETFASGILYRPEIVKEMKDMILSNEHFGTMIKGPHGIGKSHSLVNLVKNLRDEGHVVTFIPDCEKWTKPFYFLKAVCRSLGIEPSDCGYREKGFSDDDLDELVNCIKKTLKAVNERAENEKALRWILVFDQVNRIFERPAHYVAKDLGVLPPPYNLMKCMGKFVHPVVSASANNDLACRENHEGFKVYMHPIAMKREEVENWKPDTCEEFSDEQWTEIESATGLCPLQISKYLNKNDRMSYVQESTEEVLQDVGTLWRENDSHERDQKNIAMNAVRCLLLLPFSDTGAKYDKKYSVVSDWLIRPLFPSVLHAYRTFFWDHVMEYVDKNEKYLLKTCSNPRVTNDVRGRLFELIVFSRFQKKSLVSDNPEKSVLPREVDRGDAFEGQELPHPSQMENNSLFIPKNSNFPAADLILKEGNAVWAIQVHVADHPDVKPTFTEMCDRQEWFENFDNIFLLYLSPSPLVTEQLTCLPTPPSRIMKPRAAKRARPAIQVSGLSIEDFECLKDLQWPLSDAMEVDTA